MSATEPARAEDAAAVRTLLARCQLPYEDVDAEGLQHFFVVRDAERLAGVGGLQVCGRDGLLRSVAVDPQLRKRGLAERLVQAVEARAGALKLRSLFLLTTTAAPYFARRGYTRFERARVPAAVQRSSEFARLCPASAVCMVKAVG